MKAPSLPTPAESLIIPNGPWYHAESDVVPVFRLTTYVEGWHCRDHAD